MSPSIDYIAEYGKYFMGLNRPMNWDEFGMMQALAAAQRSSCTRARNGAAFLRDRRTISMGYNGSPSGFPHCNHQDGNPCDRAVHAETNAIYGAAKLGIRLEGAELYTTTSPCKICARAAIQVGASRVVYLKPYRDLEGLDILKDGNIKYVQLAVDVSFE